MTSSGLPDPPHRFWRLDLVQTCPLAHHREAARVLFFRLWSSLRQFKILIFFLPIQFAKVLFLRFWSSLFLQFLVTWGNKKNGHLRQVPRVATDPATTPVLRPLPFKTSDRSNNWIGGNLNMDIWGKVWVCFLYKTMYLSNSLRIFCQTSKGNTTNRRQEKNKTRN